MNLKRLKVEYISGTHVHIISQKQMPHYVKQKHAENTFGKHILPFSHPTFQPLSLRIILVIESINSNPNLLIQPIPRALLAHRNEWSVRSSFQRNIHAGPFLANRLYVIQLDVPFTLQLLGLNEHDAVISEHDHKVFALEFQMRNVIFMEVFAVVESLEPKLAKSFALGIRADDTIHTDKAGQSHAVEALLIEDCRGVANTFSHVW